MDADGNLWCPLPEVKAYTHSESCYTQPETEPAHIHTDECYATERGALICQLEESTGHRHTDDCYAWVAVLTCDRPAEQVLVCDKEEIILHEHNSDCFDENGSLICGKVQVLEHVHTEACFEAVDTLICDLEEHTHSAACSVIGLIEALPTQQSVEERMAAFEKAGDEAVTTPI